MGEWEMGMEGEDIVQRVICCGDYELGVDEASDLY